MVECDLAKVEVAGSNPVSRSFPSTKLATAIHVFYRSNDCLRFERHYNWLLQPSINLAAMPNIVDNDFFSADIDAIDDAVITHSQPIQPL